MSQIETVSTAMSHGGVQGVYRHRSQTCGCDMTFAVFVPPQAKNGPVPVLWYLSGLTCTHANVMEKGEYRRMAAERGMIVVCPDTSPRGDGVHDVADDWQIGSRMALTTFPVGQDDDGNELVTFRFEVIR